MDRNREGRRASMVTTSNAPTLSRRRHRTTSTTIRDSTDEDAGLELQESIRLRDRVKKERDLRDRDREKEKEKEKERDRERERERERERACRSSSKRRRAERLSMHHNSNNNNNNTSNTNNNNTTHYNNHRSEDVGLVDDTSEESVNDDEDEEYEENHQNHNSHHSNSSTGFGGGGGVRVLPPLQHRKSFPPTANIKRVQTAPVWKSGDEMIGVSVPRKARSAATKRSHDWMSSNNGGGNGGEQPIHQALLASPARQSVVTASTASPVPPMSPSSSNASIRKKLKPRPPKGSSVAKSSQNPEEIEIEIAEVLYGLMTQTQGPSSKKEISSNDSKEASNRSRVSSPISGSNTGPPVSILPQNLTSSATPFSSVAPKRKRPRQVPDNLVSSSARSSPISSTKVEIDQTLKAEVSTLNSSANLTPGTASVSYDLGSLANSQQPMEMDSERKLLTGEVVDGKIISTEKEEVGCSIKKNSLVVGQDESICEDASASSAAVAGTDILAGSVNKNNLNMAEVEKYGEEKFQIDLMAPPPLSRMSPERAAGVDVTVGDKKLNVLTISLQVTTTEASVEKEAVKMEKSGEGEMVNNGGGSKKAKLDTEPVESKKAVENKSRNIDLQLDIERPGETIAASNNLQNQGSQKQQQVAVTKATTKEEPHDEKPGLSNSSSIPLSMPSWPSGIRPMGYVPPLQGVVSMDGVAVPPAPIQMPMFSQPRPKRCATHCYIARNIHYMQQFMKMNPFWSAAAAASSASLFGSKPGNLGVVPSADLQLNTPARAVNHAQENKVQGLPVPLGHGGKEKASQHLNSSSESAQRNQQILLQQAMPPVAPNNILGPAFIFPLNQQQAAVAAAAAAVRPSSAKSPTIAPCAASSNAASNSSAVNSSATGALPAMSYNYPSMSGNETQYLAILQNNAYPFPIPTVGANPNYRGPHPQPMPFFNGFSYSSQMIHPSQLQQQALPPLQSQQAQQSHPNALLSGSSSTHKHVQSPQQTSQGNAGNGSSGNGNFQQLAAKNRSSQQSQSSTNQHPQMPQFCQVDSHVGGGDGPNTTDNRGVRAPVNMYGQNFAMPMHIPNFALITPPNASSSPGDKKHHQSQQPGMKSGVESLPPQTFAMSFGPLNGGATNPGIDLSSMAQNHAIFQNFTDASRHTFQMMAGATAGQGAHHKKDGRASEDCKTGGGDPSSECADDERKSMANKVSTTAGQSIAFSRSELPDGSTIQGSHVVESSSRSLNPTSASVRGSHTSLPNHMVSSGVQNAQLQVQLQHQQQHFIQLHKQQQQQQQDCLKLAQQQKQQQQDCLKLAQQQKQQQQLTAQQQQQQQQQQLTARSKTPVTNNGSAYPDHLSASVAAAKFPNSLSYPQNLGQNNSSNSPSQSPQWKNPLKTCASQNPSSFSSSSTATLKNIQQQQQPRALQNLTQISFGGSNQKATAASHRQPPASNQASSPPVAVDSPTTSSISKGASASPRRSSPSLASNKTGPAPSMSTQQSRSSPSLASQRSSPSTGSGRNVPSILGNPQAAPSPGSVTKSQMHAHQQQQMAKNLQQAQLFFSNPYMQNQSLHATSTNSPTSGNTGYYLQRRRPDQQHPPQPPPGSSAQTSTGTLSHSGGGGTMDPTKAIVAAGASNMKGGGFPSQSIPNASQFTEQAPGNPHHLMSGGFSYSHTVPVAVQMTPAEQKQRAGNDSLHESWQPEKK